MKRTATLLVLMSAVTFGSVAYCQSQSEMNAESLANFEKADAKLNKVYKKILAGQDDEGRKKLIAAEKAWLAYRDAEADYESDAQARGGSMAPLIYNTTCLELTEARIKALLSAESSN